MHSMEPLVWEEEKREGGEVALLANDVRILPFTSHHCLYGNGHVIGLGAAYLVRPFVFALMPPDAPFGWAAFLGIDAGKGIHVWIDSFEEGKEFCEQCREKYWKLPKIQEALRLEEDLEEEIIAEGGRLVCDIQKATGELAVRIIEAFRENDRKDESYIKQLYRVVCTNHLCPTESWKSIGRDKRLLIGN